MSSGAGRSPVESIGTFVGRRLRRFTMVAAGANLLLCLLFLFVVMRANSAKVCLIADANIQTYIEALSREIVIGNREHIETMLGTLRRSGLLGDVHLNASPDPQGAGARQCRFNGLRLEFQTPVMFGTRQVGSLQGSIAWISVAQIAAFIGAVALLSLGLMGLATRFLARDLHKALVAPIGKLARGEAPGGPVLVSDVLKIKQDLDASRENAQYAALASMTQMVAHDVRRPFSMIQVVLNGIKAARTLGEARRIAAPGAREVERALEAVTGMLSDIMEIGHDTALAREPASPRLLIDAAIREACRLSPGSRVAFSASLMHRHCVHVDPLKVQRVFSNIVGNAMQALEAGEGRIWFRTSAPSVAGRDLMELTVGNSGRHIEPEDMERLFDAFFTKGKKQGTGLGLAIAKKVIEAHGGQIGCRSSPQDGVEFWFTLPMSRRLDGAEVGLPRSSEEVHEAQRLALAGADPGGEDVPGPAPDAGRAARPSAALPPPPAEPPDTHAYTEDPVFSAWPAGAALPLSGVVAVLDDCPLHRNGWVWVNPGRPLVTFESPEAFAGYLQAHPGFLDTLAFVVTDYHFGLASAMNGLEFAKTIPGKPVFLASHGEFGNLFSRADSAAPVAGVLPRKIMGWDALHTFCAGRLNPLVKP